ncbi:unnamed protein product [Sphagnum jensenii]|uniref:BZIP domain-containing protein n=1 Tax=Sphagnum jensenii TaxID=128206 RepID=A0ABP0VMZ6_9BRYO
MASQGGQGDGWPVNNWSFPMNPSHLPPKIPAFPGFGSAQVLESTAAGHSTVSLIHGGIHKRTPSAGYLSQTQSSWMDEILDVPEGLFKPGSHRRSASESMVSLNTGYANFSNENLGEEQFDSQSAALLYSHSGSLDFDRLDDDQLMSLFENDSNSALRQQQHQGNKNSKPELATNVVASVSTAGHSSGVNTWTLERGPTPPSKIEKLSTPSESNSPSEVSNEEAKAGGPEKLKGEPEVQSTGDGDSFTQPFSKVELQQALAGLDSTLDPKRAKRILANRQSAQRSRVRKLQYISELERSVTAFQTEIATMTAQVDFYEHQRAVLNADNNTIKQRIATLAQGQRFKDAYNDALKKEIQRLRQLYQQQQLQQPQQQTLPSTGYEYQQQQFSNLDLGATHQSELNMGELNAFSGGLLQSSDEQFMFDGSCGLSPTHSHSRSLLLPHGLNGMIPASCMLPANGNGLEGSMLGEYMVHNS